MTRSVSRGIRVLAAIAATLLCGWADANAEPWATSQPCDSVTIQGVTYPRIHFSVRNSAMDLTAMFIDIRPIASAVPGDTCRVMAALAPPNWSVQVDPSGGWVIWSAQQMGIPRWTTVDGFAVVLGGKQPCCYQMGLADYFSSATQTVCFACDMPVPALRRTWGALKSAYR